MAGAQSSCTCTGVSRLIWFVPSCKLHHSSVHAGQHVQLKLSISPCCQAPSSSRQMEAGQDSTSQHSIMLSVHRRRGRRRRGLAPAGRRSVCVAEAQAHAGADCLSRFDLLQGMQVQQHMPCMPCCTVLGLRPEFCCKPANVQQGSWHLEHITQPSTLTRLCACRQCMPSPAATPTRCRPWTRSCLSRQQPCTASAWAARAPPDAHSAGRERPCSAVH